MAFNGVSPRSRPGKLLHVFVAMKRFSSSSGRRRPSDLGVVKVFACVSEPNYAVPWVYKPQDARSGTAFAVAWQRQRWLLTNAHVVRHGAVLQVRKRGDHQKFLATVRCVGLECDLAILKLGEDVEFKWPIKGIKRPKGMAQGDLEGDVRPGEARCRCLRTVEDAKFWKELPKVRLRLVSGGFPQLRRPSGPFDGPENRRFRPPKPVVNRQIGRVLDLFGPKERPPA